MGSAMTGRPGVDAALLEHLVYRVDHELGSLIGKCEGLSEYDARRPLTGSGTNLLGLLRHTAAVTLGYITECFGRPADWEMPWFGPDVEPDTDLWVPASDTRESVLALGEHARRKLADSAAALSIDSPGRVPWWGESGAVTFGQILVHVLAEVARHTGQADILREGVDGSLGMRAGDPNVTPRDEAGWAAHAARIEADAATFR